MHHYTAKLRCYKITAMWLTLFTVFIIVSQSTVVSETAKPCKTPGSTSQDGNCIKITDCPIIDNVLKSGRPDKQTIEFVQKAQCGFNGVPLICCKMSEQISTTTYSYNLFFTTPAPVITTPVADLEYFPNKEIPDRTICGSVKSTDQIAYGSDTTIGEFPWLAGIVFKSKRDGAYLGVRCGGSLINKRYILTAAHCVRHDQVEPFRVLLGDWQLSKDPDCYNEEECAPSVQNLSIAEKIQHPFYSKLKMTNDIGLLRLDKDVEFTEYVRPICLPPPNIPPLKIDKEMTVAGWGLTEYGNQSDIALKATVNLLDTQACRKLFNKKIYTKELCANSEKGDACSGDSGGPLMRTYRDGIRLNWFLEGLVGSGVDCNLKISATIYTRVSKFTGWILRQIKDTR